MSKLDMRDIKGQEHVKRGIEVALAGGHNVLFISPDTKEVYRFVKRLPTLATAENLITTYSMTPCPCGYFTDPRKECNCSPEAIQKHLSQFPTQVLDVIDIHLEIPKLNQKAMTDKRRGEASSVIKERIDRVRERIIRQHKLELDKEAKELAKLAILELGISLKAYDKIFRVANTIAIMDEKEVIEAHHLSEAISYRSLDRNLWG